MSRCPAATFPGAWMPGRRSPHSCPMLPLAFACRAELGQLPSVASLFRTVPVVHHMLGPLDAQPRQKRQIVRNARQRRGLPTGRQPFRV